MKLFNTSDPTAKPSILMVVYGEGGVGKTTFASTAPSPLIADCENGSKYFGIRGISADVALIEGWPDMRDFMEEALSEKYETIIIDPIGELMEKLMRYMVSKADSKLVQKDGAPTMAGWGWLKQTMRNYLKLLRDSGKHIIIVAHVEEKDDEGRLVKRPMVATKLSEELINMVDIVGYMTTVTDSETSEIKRIIIVDPASDKQVAKDRTGKLGRYIEPDFSKIVNGIRGDKTYSWLKPDAPNPMKSEKKDDSSQPHPPIDDTLKNKVMDKFITIGFNSMGRMWFFKEACGLMHGDWTKLKEKDWSRANKLIDRIESGEVIVKNNHLEPSNSTKAT